VTSVRGIYAGRARDIIATEKGWAQCSRMSAMSINLNVVVGNGSVWSSFIGRYELLLEIRRKKTTHAVTLGAG
jgi:hypothetical protein